MIKFALPLLALTVAAPVVAQAPVAQPIAFERDGVRYQATVRTEDGVTYINGKEVDSGRAFDLKVVKGHVVGRYDNQNVRYDAPVSHAE